MITKGYVIVSHPIDKIYLAVLEACEELKANINNRYTPNDGGYIFEGKTAAIFSSTTFQIILQPKQSGTLIEIYNYISADTPFIFSFFKALAKRVPLDSGLRIYDVETPTVNELPTYAVAEYNHKLVVSPDLLKNFEYDIEVISDGGIPKLQGAKKLFNRIDGGRSRLEFKRGKNILFMIPLKEIEKVQATSYMKGLLRKGNDFVLEFVFHDSQQNKKSIILNIEDKYVHIIQQQIAAIRDSESGLHNVLWGNPSKICTNCTNNSPSFEFSTQYLCLNCFDEKYGKIKLKENIGEYYGGHKTHLAGGTFGGYERGRMYLTDKYLIFAKGSKDTTKRWEIEIPLSRVVVEQWNVKGESRRKQFVGGSTAVSRNFAFGGGTIQESGQRHRLLVPYIDENGFLQEPIFGVSSIGGKAIRKWAAELYEILVKIKQSESENLGQVDSSQAVTDSVKTDNNSEENPINILKLRFAKGEISKEEYEAMRKIIES